MPSLNTGNAILSNAIAVNSSYNVGIGGAASGSFKLDVTGNVNLSGNATTTGAQFVQNGFYLANANAGATAFYTNMWGADDGIQFALRNLTGGARFIFQSAASYNYTFPATTGTLALTSNLSAYLPLTGGTLTGGVSGTSATFSSSVTATTGLFAINNSDVGNATGIRLQQSGSGDAAISYLITGTREWLVGVDNSDADAFKINNITGSSDFNNVGLSIASTGAATFTTNSNSTITNVFQNTNTTDTNSRNYLNVVAGNVTTSIQAIHNDHSYINVTNHLYFQSAGSVKMTMLSNGNVGIGTSAPTPISTFTTLEIRGATGGGIKIGETGLAQLNIQQDGTDAYLNNTANGSMYFYTNDTERLRITSNGLVQISNPTADAQLKLAASGSTAYVSFSNSAGDLWGLGNSFAGTTTNFELYNFTAAAYGFRITRSGIYATTASSPRNVYVQSDGTLGGISSILASKTNIKKFNTNWLYDLNPIQFNYRKKDESNQYTDEFDNELFYGLIAEETELVNKEICNYNENKLIGIEYSKLVPVLVKAIQELNQKINEQQQTINSLINR